MNQCTWGKRLKSNYKCKENNNNNNNKKYFTEKVGYLLYAKYSISDQLTSEYNINLFSFFTNPALRVKQY